MSTETSSVITEERIIELIKEANQSQVKTWKSEEKPVEIGNFSWEGLEKQAQTLKQVDECLLSIKASVDPEKSELDGDKVLESVEKARALIKQRVKILQIAEAGGWSAVKKYEGAASIGDDASDAKKIQKCIDDAKAERDRSWRPRNQYVQQNQNGGSYVYGGYRGRQMSGYRYPGRYQAMAYRFPQAPYRPRYGFPGTSAPKMVPQEKRLAVYGAECHLCGLTDHWKSECPYGQQVFPAIEPGPGGEK